MARILAAALLGAAVLPAQGRTDPAGRIENDRLVVTVSLRTGAIESVLRKASGFRHDPPAERAEILDLRVPLEDWDGHSLAGSEAAKIQVLERTPDSLVLHIGRFDNATGQWPIEAWIHYRLERDNLVARLRLANRATHAVDRIAFPMLGVRAAADGSELLYMASGPLPLKPLFSENAIRTHHDPFQRLDPTDFRGWWFSDPAVSTKGFEYPSASSRLHTAWLSYQAGDESVGWDVRDRLFQSQFAVVQRDLQRGTRSQRENHQSYTLAWHWFPIIAPGAAWESPEVWLRFDRGDWHGIARQHREWLASWIRKPEPPEAFRSSLGWISQGITSFDEIPLLARRGVAVGAPYFIVYGWYGYGMSHLSYDYFPRPMLGGAASLRRNLAAARELGAYPLAWYNGSTTVESTTGHLRQGRDWSLVDRYGGFSVDGRWSLFDPDRPQTTDDNVVHLNYDLGTGARDFVIDTVRRIVVDYGFSGLEMDQGGKNFRSYAGQSGPGPELKFTEGVRAVYDAVMAIVRANDPDGIVVGEGISDFMNQYVDASWHFEGGGGIFSDPRSWAQTSSYLRYSLPWVVFPIRAIPEDPGHANQAFLLNAPLDIFADLEQFPDYAHHLQRLHALKRQVHPYLYRGMFSDTEGFELRDHDPAAILARSYLETGRVTVVVVNTGRDTQAATVEFPGAEPPSGLREYRLGGAMVERPGGRTTELQLGPHEVCVLVADRSGARR